MAFGFGGGRKTAAQETAATAVPPAKAADPRTAKEELKQLRGEASQLLKDAKDPAKQEGAALAASHLEARAEAAAKAADANLKAANKANDKQAAGAAKAQKVGALRIQADAVHAQIPAAQTKAQKGFEAAKSALATSEPALKGGAKKAKEAALKKEAFKETEALKGEEKTLRSQARKIETETRKSTTRDEAAAFKSEVRGALKEIKGLLMNGNGTLTQQLETAERIASAAKGKLGRDLNPIEEAVVAQRARFAPKGSGHADKVKAEQAAGAAVSR